MFQKKDKKEEDIKLVTLVSSGDVLYIGLIKSILTDAKIPFMAKNEQLQNLFGFGNLGGHANPLSGPIEIVVKEEDYETAKKLIENSNE